MLLRAGALINLETTLVVASRYGDLEIVSTLLKMGSKVNGPDMRAMKTAVEEWDNELKSKLSELWKSSLEGGTYFETERIKKDMWSNVTAESLMYMSKVHKNNLEAPIIAAARAGHPEIVSLLLDSGADPDILRLDPGTGDPMTYALGVAARMGFLDVIRVLLDRGASVDGPTQFEELRNSGNP